MQPLRKCGGNTIRWRRTFSCRAAFTGTCATPKLREAEKTSDNFRFAAAVAQFGMLLRNSAFKSNASYNSVLQLAKNAKGSDEEGYRSEFIRLVSSARSLAVNSNDDGEEDVSVIND